MTNDRIFDWMHILRKLAELGGSQELTQLYPNAQIVDADYAAGFIKVRGRTGAYEAAVRVAGIEYTTGEYVNLLYIKGSEPVVVGHGSMSAYSGPGGAPGMPDHTHTDTDGEGGELDIIDLTTTEVNTALVLVPDGVGGVEWESSPASVLADHDHSGDAGDGGQLQTSAALLSTGIVDGNYPAADGANNVQWRKFITFSATEPVTTWPQMLWLDTS